MAARIKRDDTVQVITGKDKGVTGKVLKVIPEFDKLIVEGVNMIKRHQSPKRFAQGGIVEREAPIDACKVMLLDPESQKPTRVKFEERDGKKVRVAVKSGAVLD